MANEIQRGSAELTPVEQALVGDLSQLDPAQRLEFFSKVCESLGLNPLTRPFDFITLNGKLTLYAKKDCTDQLRKIHRVSVKIADRTRIDDLLVVTAQATLPDGRSDESIGAVNIKGLYGDNLANAFMKAETKSKRRVTLSICGLGVVDESEVEGDYSPPAERFSVAPALLSADSVAAPPAGPTLEGALVEIKALDSLGAADALAKRLNAARSWTKMERETIAGLLKARRAELAPKATKSNGARPCDACGLTNTHADGCPQSERQPGQDG